MGPALLVTRVSETDGTKQSPKRVAPPHEAALLPATHRGIRYPPLSRILDRLCVGMP